VPDRAIDIYREEGPTLCEPWSRAGHKPGDLQIQGDLDAVRDERGRSDLSESLEVLPDRFEAGATMVNVVMSLFGGGRRRSSRPWAIKWGRI
jgi:hypothetical protein